MPLQKQGTGGAGGVLRGQARCFAFRRPTVPRRSESSLGGACRAMKPLLASTLTHSWRGVLLLAGSLGGYDGEWREQTGIALREKKEQVSTTHPFPPLAGTGKSEWFDKASPSVVSVAWSHETGAGIALASQRSYWNCFQLNPENSRGLCICQPFLNSFRSTTRRIRAFVAMRSRFYGFTKGVAVPALVFRHFNAIPSPLSRLQLCAAGLERSPVKNETQADTSDLGFNCDSVVSLASVLCSRRLYRLRSASNLSRLAGCMQEKSLHPSLAGTFNNSPCAATKSRNTAQVASCDEIAPALDLL